MAPQYKVFIIEDDSMMQIQFTNLLKKAGHEVIGAASTGTESLKKVEDLSPDVVFVDIGLPDIHGIEVIKKIQHHKPVAVVVLSSEDRLEIVSEASQAGAFAYIVKPPELREVERAIVISMAQFKSQMQMRGLNELLFRSIEERKKAEVQLSESERNFRALTENTSDIIIRHDESKRFSYVNPAFEKAMNIPSIKTLGNTMESFIDDPEKRNYYESILVKVFQNGISTHFEIRY
jgi:two-component system, response regulator PdtaR